MTNQTFRVACYDCDKITVLLTKEVAAEGAEAHWLLNQHHTVVFDTSPDADSTAYCEFEV
jgi:hypothetical protein